MRRRRIIELRPGLERLEQKQLLSAGSLTTHVVNLKTGSRALALHSVETSGAHGAASGAASDHGGLPVPADRRRRPSPATKFTVFRITNTAFPDSVNLVPPFQQVLVQSVKPRAGRVYNVLSLLVRNGTAQTFDASSGFAVRVSSSGSVIPRSLPILTGTEQWKPGQFIVFYILTKKYYPVNPVQAAGFQFDFAGSSAIAIPGPSGIFLRLKYNPATFNRTLDWIVAFGQGPELGKGPRLGLPDTAIWQLTSANTNLEPL